MATEIPIIQVLSRNNYEEQHIVSLPSANSLPPLGSSSLRIKPTILTLSTNNLTYARVGHLLGWWDIHPLPPSIPAEFANSKKYGRISAWGYGVVLESTVSSIEAGTQVYGYLPIGTLPIDMQVEVKDNVTGRFDEVSKYRAHVLPIYNQFQFYLPFKAEQERIESRDSQALDSAWTLFGTSYGLNRFVFPWNPSELVYPSGNSNDGWNIEKATLDSKSVVILFSASGKTALALAHLLKYGRPAGKAPGVVVGVGSDASKTLTQETGLYDKILNYVSDSGDLATELGLRADSKVVLCDFGARDGAADRWAAKLAQNFNIVRLRIGGEVTPDSPEEATAKFMASTKAASGAVPMLNASTVRSQAVNILGEQKYFDELGKELSAFKEQGGVKGVRLVWGHGMEDLGKAWERLCEGKVGPDENLVFDLSEKVSTRL